jgi:8-oxo-dGTP pyrophosphatase MutT (NUDIX family)
MINGSFILPIIQGNYLFIKRKDKQLWDLPGGGFEKSEIDYRGVAQREMQEECGILLPRENIHLFANLGQKLKKAVAEVHGVEYGFLFLHYAILHEVPKIIIGDEHLEYRMFTQQEIIAEWETFSSGPLWEFFTYLSFLETNKFQEGMLFERRIFNGKEYYKN